MRGFKRGLDREVKIERRGVFWVMERVLFSYDNKSSLGGKFFTGRCWKGGLDLVL